MPYLITTKNRLDHRADVEALLRGRRAVATLEEARIEAAVLLRSHGEEGKAQGVEMWLPESGGTVTLPDGTVIEVEAKSWADIAEAVKFLGRGYVTESEWPEVLDAFNAREQAAC
jgi:hypothetical protein